MESTKYWYYWYGGRGSHLVRGAGLPQKDDNSCVKANQKILIKPSTFMSQDDLNCSLVGVGSLM